MKRYRWCMMILLIFLVPVLVNYTFLYATIPTASGLTNSSWLDFWGGYLGAAIGCIPAFLALRESQKQSKDQHTENMNSRRLSVLPVLSCEANTLSLFSGQPNKVLSIHGFTYLNQTSGFYGYFRSHDFQDYISHAQSDPVYANDHYIFFEIKNIGLGPALNISLRCTNASTSEPMVVQSLGCGDMFTLILSIQPPNDLVSDNVIRYDIQLSFVDSLGNQYQQTQPLLAHKEHFSIQQISPPLFVHDGF